MNLMANRVGIGSMGMLNISFTHSTPDYDTPYKINITKSEDTVCAGYPSYLSIAGNDPVWSTGETSSQISVSPDTTSLYTVQATRNISTITCTLQASDVVVVHPRLLATISGISSSGNNGMATVLATGGTPPYTYLWSNGATTDSITDLTPEIYSVTVTDANGCEKERIIQVIYVGINEPDNIQYINTYPNPSTGNFNIEVILQKESNITVEVTNIFGQIVYSINLMTKSAVIPVSLPYIDKGLYMATIRSQTYTEHMPLIIEH